MTDDNAKSSFVGQPRLLPYEPLPTSTSIRVLDISTELKINKKIACDIKVVDLDSTPDFCALSYTWGESGANPTDEQNPSVDEDSVHGGFEILCNGFPFQVTRNCYAYLVMLQRAKRFLSSSPTVQPELVQMMTVGLIWIDAICINQSSVEERSAQVRIMDRIYKQARKVVVWLGPSDSMTKPALNAIHTISNVSMDACKEVYGKSISNPKHYEKLGIPFISKEEWLAIRALYQRSWFSRAWTVQEYVLAREAVLQCGSIIVNFHGIPYAARITSLIGWDLAIQVLDVNDSTNTSSADLFCSNDVEKPVQEGRKLVKGLTFSYPILFLGYLQEIQTHPWNISSSKEQWESEDRVFPLQAALSAASHTSCLNPVDKIYSLLGLVPKASWKGLPIDYSASTVDVFVQATRALIRATSSLSLLSFVEDKAYRKIQSLPSWVPDYTAFRGIMPLDWGGHPGMHPVPGFRNAFFDASHGMPFSIGSAGDMLSRLSVSGIFVGTVERIAPFDPAALHKLEPLLDVITALPKNWLWRTIIGDEHIIDRDRGSSYQPALESDGKMFEQWLFDNVFSLLRKTQASLSDHTSEEERSQAIKYALREYTIYKSLIGSTFCPTRTQLVWFDWEEYSLKWIQEKEDLEEGHEVEGLKQPKDLDFRLLTKFMMSVDARMSERVLFTTQSRQLGAGIISMQENDEIWVLAGAKVPYMLRPNSGLEYELIGEAYVHNIMHGELVKERRNEIRDIVLI